MAKILISSDVPPNNPKRHFNGVMRYLGDLQKKLTAGGHEVLVVSPDQFKGFYLPTLPEIRWSFPSKKKLAKMIERFQPDFIHIEYEGPVGKAVQKYCLKRHIPFTTCFHSRYDLHVEARFKVPARFIKPLMLKFHRRAHRVMTRTFTMASFLKKEGLDQAVALKPTVDPRLFYCRDADKRCDTRWPTLIYVGRVAPEKNLEAFLSLNIPGKKVVVGIGPSLAVLKKNFPQTHFVGYRDASGIRQALNESDIFVMPSKTETLGRVMLEAMACGVPVAAYPVEGPIDVVKPEVSGYLSEDLAAAIEQCKAIPRCSVLNYAKQYVEADIASEFLKHLVPVAL